MKLNTMAGSPPKQPLSLKKPKIPVRITDLILFLCLLGSLACQNHWLEPILGPADRTPPQILSVRSESGKIFLQFDEVLSLSVDFQIQPELSVTEAKSVGKELQVSLAEVPVPGTLYTLKGEVADTAGNTLHFLEQIYGPNPDPAEVLINELNPKGEKSSNNPEVIELYVQKSGNMGGLTITVETPGSVFVFPSLIVNQGDYILLHTRWDSEHPGDINQVNETENRAEAQARLTDDNAWDFWLPNLKGLTDSNNAIVIYSSPRKEEIQDTVIYSNSAAGERHRGWKSDSLLSQADLLSKAAAWLGAADLLVPEDAVPVDGSTGTRSLSRLHQNGVPIDHNRKTDWITVQTRGSTFGSENSLTPHN